MTAAGAGYSDCRRLVADALSLALGAPAADVDTADWRSLFEFALRERCAALAWARSGALIRQHAPADVVADWRGHALMVAANGERALQVLADVQRRLLEDGVSSVSVKGPTFALELYGEPVVRPMDDLDLFVPSAHREAARRRLASEGWHCIEHLVRAEQEVFERRVDGALMRLDLFSRFPKSLPSGTGLAPPSERREIGGHVVVAHAGPSLAPYLASHLAKHEFPPLLWFVDFATLWSALSAQGRQAARDAAGELRLHRYLEWAVARAEILPSAAAGDASALAMLGVSATERTQPRIWVRKIRLAGSVMEALRVLWSYLLPASERSVPALLRMIVRRLRNLPRMLSHSRPMAPASRGVAAPSRPTTRDSRE